MRIHDEENKEVDVTSLTYEVTENGEYTFFITYQQGVEDIGQEQLRVVIEDIVIQRTENKELVKGNSLENVETNEVIAAIDNSVLGSMNDFITYCSPENTLSIHGNVITMGNTWNKKKQNMTATTKKSIDFNRSFTFLGTLTNGTVDEGLAIAFHTTKDYQFTNNDGKTLGVYGLNSRGITNGVVLEVDSKANGKVVGDTGFMSHISINTTDENGENVECQAIKNYMSPSFMGKDKPLEIRWNVETKVLTYKHNGDTLTYAFNPAEQFKGEEVYLTLASSLSPLGIGFAPYEVVINSFEYIDLKDEVLSNVYVQREGTMVEVYHDICKTGRNSGR